MQPDPHKRTCISYLPRSLPLSSPPRRRRRRRRRDLGAHFLFGDPLGSSCDPTMKLLKPIDLFQKLLKNGAMKKGRLLGLDVGNKYVGLAVSDSDNKVASPISVLVRKENNIDLMAKDFQILVTQHSLVGFVVGYPFALKGQAHTEAVQVRLFMEALERTGKLDGLSYAYWDENFTSKCVEALLEPLHLHPVTSKTIIDKFAAVGILQGYLDNMLRIWKSGDMSKD